MTTVITSHRLCRYFTKTLSHRRFYAIISVKVVAEIKIGDEIDYAKIAREYFKSKKVYKYKMRKISDMNDEEVIQKCHFWQEENNMVDDYWNFVNSFEN